MTTTPKKIIFLTNPEFGQLNVQLSTAYALLQLAPHVEVHFATHRNVEAQVRATSDMALKRCPPGRTPIIFHHVGPSYMECLDSKPRSGKDELLVRPGFRTMWPRADWMVSLSIMPQKGTSAYPLFTLLDDLRLSLGQSAICRQV